MSANLIGANGVSRPPSTWQDQFVEKYAETMNLRASALYAGVTRPTVYKYLKSDPIFAERVKLAKEDAVDTLEQAVLQRARDGFENEHPIYYRGVWEGERIEHKFST